MNSKSSQSPWGAMVQSVLERRKDLLIRLKSQWGKYKTFEEMPTSHQCFLGLAILPSLFYFYVLTQVIPKLMEATRTAPFSWVEIPIWLFIGILALYALHLGWVAKRCGELIYKRFYQ
jgi:hypothetical protein